MLVVLLLIADLHDAHTRRNQRDHETCEDNGAELGSDVLSNTVAIGLALVSGEALPVGLVFGRVVVVEVIAQDAFNAKLDDQTWPAHWLWVHFGEDASLVGHFAFRLIN